ncbi:MAG: ATP-dependent DNA ligase [Chryseolinea sp.]
MKQFTQLFLELDRTNKTNEKVALLKAYFLTAPEEDRLWALALFTGRRPPRNFKTAQIHAWALEKANIPEWLYKESYNSVGDMAETISLLLPITSSTSQKTLREWFHALSEMNKATEEEKKQFILAAWEHFSPHEIFVFNKLIMGSFRIGVSQTLVVRAVSESIQQDPALITHRIMGDWDPFKTTFNELILGENANDQLSKPYPFYLAYAIEGSVDALGNPDDWFAEWKWDGIRAQIIFRNHVIYIWSRGEELVTDKFPELKIFSTLVPDGTVLDGEIVCFRDGKPMPFNVLQTRIGRKNVTKKILDEAPSAFIVYDLLELNGVDIRQQPQQKRRAALEQLHLQSNNCGVFKLSKLIKFNSWEELKNVHHDSRANAAEGFMIKRKEATYQMGRKKGDWWKWKINPLSVDAVLIYAQKGHGRRTEFYTDYTFAVWDNDRLVPFAKAYSGLTDEEIRQVDHFIRQNTIEKFGPVRNVKPQLIFEIGFEGINVSPRHKSGIAVRFPRMLRWRKDKPVEEANTLEDLQLMLANYA